MTTELFRLCTVVTNTYSRLKNALHNYLNSRSFMVSRFSRSYWRRFDSYAAGNCSLLVCLPTGHWAKGIIPQQRHSQQFAADSGILRHNFLGFKVLPIQLVLHAQYRIPNLALKSTDLKISCTNKLQTGTLYQ
jgi:hypothetical protein